MFLYYFTQKNTKSFIFDDFFRAENEVRTRDPQLGKLMLYQLSYFRFGISAAKVMMIFDSAKKFSNLIG